MSGSIVRQLKPEEKELLLKREELATIRSALAERELELVDLRSELAVFEGRYLRQVAALYAELDDWKARIAELLAKLNPSIGATLRAEKARQQAHQTNADAHGAAAGHMDFSPSPELKKLYRETARSIHPDFASEPADRERRTRLMAEANRAYETGDLEALQRIWNEYQDTQDDIEGEDIGAALVRIIRQISLAKDRLSTIERELEILRGSEIALLQKQAQASAQDGIDLLEQLAESVQEQIDLAKKEFNALSSQEEASNG